MKKVFLTALIILASVIPTFAQSSGSADTEPPTRFEFALNPISYLRQGGQNLRGGSFNLAMRRSQRVSYILDIAVHQTRPAAATADSLPHPDSFNVSAYRFGLRYYSAARGKFTPFGEVLAGGASLGAKTTTTLTPTTTGTTTSKTTILDGSHTGVGFGIGGGVDYTVRPWFSWRVFQADYNFIHAGGNTSGVRIHTGGVFHFGH